MSFRRSALSLIAIAKDVVTGSSLVASGTFTSSSPAASASQPAFYEVRMLVLIRNSDRSLADGIFSSYSAISPAVALPSSGSVTYYISFFGMYFESHDRGLLMLRLAQNLVLLSPGNGTSPVFYASSSGSTTPAMPAT